MDQATAKCVGLPEGKADTSLLEGALEALEALHVGKAQRGLLGWAGSRASVEGPLGLGEGLVQYMLGVGQTGEGGPQVGQLSVKVFWIADPEGSEKERRDHTFLDREGMVREEVDVHPTVHRLSVHRESVSIS